MYLASAREHPAAVVRRRQAEDVARLAPTIRHLTERQYELFFLFQSVITRYRPDGLARLVDADVADAAGALAATLETASRGVIYEHKAQSHLAQSLTAAMKALLEEIRKHGHVLTPGRYVGAEAGEDDAEPFEEKMKRLVATLRDQQAEAAKLDAAIAANLKELGYGG